MSRIQSPFLRNLLEWGITLGLAVLVFFASRAWLVRVAHVDGSSMEPTLFHGDRLILSRLALRITSPRQGDIVAFPCIANPSAFYIKRVVAMPGDVVDFSGGEFLINDEPLDDAFTPPAIFDPGDMDFPITVEYGRYFVLGDNRNGSKDSRFRAVGTVCGDEMVGRVLLRIWPLRQAGTVE